MGIQLVESRRGPACGLIVDMAKWQSGHRVCTVRVGESSHKGGVAPHLWSWSPSPPPQE